MQNKIERFIQNWIVNAKGISLDEIGLIDNFFEKGWLDSLAMFRMLLELELEFDLQLDLDRLFTDAEPNITSLAKYLEMTRKSCQE